MTLANTSTSKNLLGGNANWLNRDLQQSEDWIHIFNAAEIAEIEKAVALSRSRGCSLKDLTAEDFPLPF